MQVNIESAPAYAMAYVLLEAGETVMVERGSMALMSDGIEAKGGIHGGLTKALLRKQFGGESFFQGRYTSSVHGAWIAVAPHFPGDLVVLDIDPGHPIISTTGAVVAHADSVEVDLKYGGVKGMVLKEGLTALRLHGQGKAILGSYGGIQKFDLPAEQSLTIDTGHLVAWSATCSIQLGILGGVVASQLTGEGFVGRLTGPGSVWIQTRAEQDIRNWIVPERLQNTDGKKH